MDPEMSLTSVKTGDSRELSPAFLVHDFPGVTVHNCPTSKDLSGLSALWTNQKASKRHLLDPG
jgi:hypothetical protein